MEDQIHITRNFTPDDIKTAFTLSQNLYGIKVKETPIQNNEDLIVKYQSLKALKGFF